MKRILLTSLFITAFALGGTCQIFNVSVGGNNIKKKEKNKTTKNKNKDNTKDTPGDKKVDNSEVKPDLLFIKDECSINITTNNTAFSVKVDFKFQNSSKANVGKGIHLGFYLTTGPEIGDSIKRLVNWEVPSDLCAECWYKNYYSFNIAHSEFLPLDNGKYYMMMVIDNGNSFTESNEENNWIVIDTPIDYVLPDGVKEYHDYTAKQNKIKDHVTKNAGKIMFGLGQFDFTAPHLNTYSNKFSFADMINSSGSDKFGEELSFAVIFSKPLPDLFKEYRDQGLNAKAWKDDQSWVTLDYKILVDGTEVFESTNEPEQIKFKSLFYSKQLTGTYASGQKLQLQLHLLNEMYKLTSGDHNVKVQAFVQSTVYKNRDVAPTPVAEGEFTISVSVQDKINHFKKWSKLKPSAKMSNSTLSGQLKTLVLDYFSDANGGAISTGDIKHFAITESTWKTKKNALGEILSRSIRFNVHIAFKDGSCTSHWFHAVEDYLGGGKYTKPQYLKSDGGDCMPCEAIK